MSAEGFYEEGHDFEGLRQYLKARPHLAGLPWEYLGSRSGRDGSGVAHHYRERETGRRVSMLGGFVPGCGLWAIGDEYAGADDVRVAR